MDLHLRGEISRRSFLTCLGASFIATQTAYANRDSGKEVYLTIDDGPSPNMKKILDELEKHPDNYVTFFMVGENFKDEKNFGLAREAIEKGHSIGNHTYSHKRASKVSYEKFVNEIKACGEIIDDLYSNTRMENPRLFRFPYGDKGGKKNKTAIKEYLEANGFSEFFWDGDTLDWKYYSGNRSLEKVLNEIRKVQDGEIVLTHDMYRKGLLSTPVEAIKVLSEMGFVSKVLDGYRQRRGKVRIEGPEYVLGE